MSDALPLFPLNTLLVPEATLPLQIFEQRYLRLIKQCLRDQTTFGVVPIRDGREVGVAAMIYQVGVVAHISDWSQGANGLLHIKVVGGRKFRVLQTSVEEDQLMQAQVEYLPEESTYDIPDEFSGLAELFKELGDHPQVQALGLPPALTANQLGWFLTQLLPLSRSEQVEMLAMQEPLVRLEKIAEFVDRLSREG
ncbi:LON peptidase substrate-binding domain-containing protein [Halioxenophilus sp. WMMB6]|uniref:LON peptidase substrate-binding domain-containing protein n=1 Tax=Halioxenophilus sp. WMMB6 TaxID=3073815 RepID=UPI00295E3ACD|nr:LON peptidase substrate-binding domain-containing protein [Halioxenophilus sp. WMMB6]